VSPRPRKPRRCSCPFRGDADLVFKPAGIPLRELERLNLGRDELEALILCDRDGLTQVEAGARMGVSRGTVQRLVSGARRTVAEALSGGKALFVHPEEGSK